MWINQPSWLKISLSPLDPTRGRDSRRKEAHRFEGEEVRELRYSDKRPGDMTGSLGGI